MNVLETDNWSMALPQEWWAEEDDDRIMVGDHDEVGCIEISTLLKDGEDFSEQDLATIAGDSDASDPKAVTLGDFEGLYALAKEDGVAIREWIVAAGRVLLFITYSCDDEHSGLDDAAVDELLSTLLLK